MPAGKAHRPLHPPWRLLLLDLIGTLLVALGLYDLLTQDTRLFAEDYYAWALVLAGLAIMLPAVKGLLTCLAQARRR